MPDATLHSLASDAHWADVNKRWGFAPVADHDVMRKWLLATVPAGHGEACLEVGCFPGRYMAVLGQMGYEMHGIDLAEGTDTAMVDWLKKEGCRVGRVVKDNFLTHAFERKYDMVFSFGFLEHFEDWKRILARHAELVADGGWLVVTTPNFRGPILHPLRRWLDAENLARHNVASMAPDQWAEELKKLGFEIVMAGYVGRFEFFAGRQDRGFIKKALVRGLEYAAPWIRKYTRGGPLTAAYCAVAARKVGRTS